MFKFKTQPLYAAILMASAAVPAISNADTTDYSLIMEEIVVTTRQRAETLQEIPVAVNAFSSEDIERQDIQELRDALRGSPGVNYNSSGSSSTGTIVMRGMSQPGLIGDETNVAVFVDGVYFSGRESAFVPMMGLDRLEVVRGPQSAIYGRNAFSGAINYVTSKPGEEWDGKVEATVGDNNRDGLKVRVSGPLTENIGFSLDATDTNSGSTNEKNGTYLGATENEAQRLRLVYSPTENLEVDFNYTHIDMLSTTQAGFNVEHNAQTPLEGTFMGPFVGVVYGPGAPEAYNGAITAQDNAGAAPGAFGNTSESDRFSLTVNYETDSGTFTSITGKGDTEARAITGYDNVVSGDQFIPEAIPGVEAALLAASGSFFFPPFTETNGVTYFAGAPGAGVYKVAANFKEIGGQPNDDRKDFSQEFRFVSDTEGDIHWSAGLLYAKTELNQWLWDSPVAPQDALSAAIVPYMTTGVQDNGNPFVIQATRYETETKSAFASVGWDVNEKLTLTVEGRYTEEEKDIDNYIDQRGQFPNPTGKDSANFYAFSPRVTASYAYDDFTNLYFNVAEGTKSGGINPGAELDAEADFDAETNRTYEMGIKRQVMEGRGYYNLSFYYVDWQDQQIRGFASNNTAGNLPAVIVTNIGETTIKGMEAEVAFQSDVGLVWKASYTYNDAEVSRGVMSSFAGFTDYESLNMNGVPLSSLDGGTIDSLVSDGDISGNTMTNAPKSTVNFSVSYSTMLDNGLELWGNVDYNWVDKTYLNAINTMWIDDHDDINLQLGLEGTNWYGKLAISNLLDDDTPTTAYRPFLWNFTQQQQAVNRNGRMTSLSVGYNF